MSTRLGIVVELHRVVAAAVRNGRAEWAAEASYEGLEELVRVLGTLAAERPARVRRTSVLLDTSVSRTRTVEGLPRLAPEDLAAHVRLHTRRYFAQNGVPLVTDARPAANGALLAAASAPLVDAIASGLASAGLYCDAIVPAGAIQDGVKGVDAAVAVTALRLPSLRLVPDAIRAEEAARSRRALRRWTVAAVIAVVAALAAHPLSFDIAEGRARRELARLGEGADVATRVRRDLDAVTAALATLSQATSGSPGYAKTMDALTAAMPDSAFLISVSFEGPNARITGYAPSAAAVVPRLERSPQVASARLAGPTAREVIAGRERERFTIMLALRPRGNP